MEGMDDVGIGHIPGENSRHFSSIRERKREKVRMTQNGEKD